MSIFTGTNNYIGRKEVYIMPENSSNNNTNSLGSGVGTHNFDNYTSRMLDAEVSRHNYQVGVKDDKQLQEFRDLVYKMVSTWLYEDKIRIVSEYGDSELLDKNPKEKELNAICTESLIIHLPKADLQKLVSEVRVKENNLKKDVDKAKKNREKAGTDFNVRTFREMFDDKKPDQKNSKELLKSIKELDKSYKIPRDIKQQFSKLERELREVLKECYNKTTLAALGLQMGLDLEVDETTLKKSIINKTLLYVALITGASKNETMGNAIVDPRPYNSLLHFTSYSYITGEPGMDLSEWKQLRDQARRAKQSIKIMSQIRRKRSLTSSSAFKTLSGGHTKAKDIAKNDIGVL